MSVTIAVSPSDEAPAEAGLVGDMLVSQWNNSLLLGLPYLVFILKFELVGPWVVGKRVYRI